MPDVRLYRQLIEVFVVFEQFLSVVINFICKLNLRPAMVKKKQTVMTQTLPIKSDQI